ncbi:MAG: hypothetical protein JST66_00575 [Bacteroidetes bacterium]|nr:hypothetical protein [Bacteroidota bacterium]
MALHRSFRSAAVILALTGCTVIAHAQDAPLFPGEPLLDTCRVDLPLTYSKADKERYVQAARFLEDQELAYLRFDKKKGAATYTRVYVMVETSKDGSEVVYLETTDDHMRMGGAKQAFFPRYNKRTERFYQADCFDRQVAQHPELKEILTESGR